VELLVFLPYQPEMHTYRTLADGHELEQRGDELLQLLRPEPGRGLAGQERGAHTQYATVDLCHGIHFRRRISTREE
jgi:hypothetical protein